LHRSAAAQTQFEEKPAQISFLGDSRNFIMNRFEA
jgi:hypothetical protein